MAEPSRAPVLMQHWSILGTAFTVRGPETVVEALRQAGFPGARASEIKRSGRQDIQFALHYAPERAPLFVAVEEMIWAEHDLNTSAWEMVEEKINDPTVLRRLRCYADVRHYENADRSAVQGVVDFLMTANNRLLLFTSEMT